jgi:PEGA domain
VKESSCVLLLSFLSWNLTYSLAQDQSARTSGEEKPRVLVTDSQSWEMTGASGGSSAGFGGEVRGGARPQTAEIIKTFGEKCPDVTINNKRERADYVVLLDHEGGKGYARKDNKVAVFNRDGDSIVSHSTRSLGNAVKDACEAITKDWPTRLRKASTPAAVESVVATPDVKPASSTANRVSVSSIPPNADIEIDGSFVGNTPSDVQVSEGDHTVSVKKAGFKNWERRLKVSAGSSVHLSAELEKADTP